MSNDCLCKSKFSLNLLETYKNHLWVPTFKCKFHYFISTKRTSAVFVAAFWVSLQDSFFLILTTFSRWDEWSKQIVTDIHGKRRRVFEWYRYNVKRDSSFTFHTFFCLRKQSQVAKKINKKKLSTTANRNFISINNKTLYHLT